MNKFFTLFFIVLLTFSVNAQNENENSLLWEISGNNLEQPSYIYGTIHLIPKDDFFFYDLWLEKFKTCDVLVLETDIEIGIMKQLSLIPKMQLPNKTTLSDYMSDKEFAAFNSYLLDSLEISETNYKVCLTYKPFFAYSLLLNEAIPGKKIIYEQYLTDEAKKNKMKVVSLETLDFQLSLVDSISIEDQIKMFLFDYEKIEQTNLLFEFNKMLELYKKQDLNSIANMESEGEENDFFYERFLVKRNLDWIGKINAILEKKSAFIAVGAAHLPGNDGVIKLLRDEGYIVKPVLIKE
ncbi:MAG: TraB/GumN family protein [Bacteroidales bacterium]|nr:TraB/GumN family protein [Bacteroidales bacterium]